MSAAPTNLPSHPEGEIKTYLDFFEREQTSVTGPKGHVLITRGYEREPYRVWHSDSIDTIVSTGVLREAIAAACRATGLDPAALVYA